jgi:Na+/H+ antiporter NhaD/arsenite permease-like protein
VATAAVPQVLAAAAVGGLLVVRIRRSRALHGVSADVPVEVEPGEVNADVHGPDRASLAAGLVAAVGAVLAVVVGVLGGDVSLVFLVVAAGCSLIALLDGATSPRPLLASIPISGIVVVLAAAVARQPMADVAAGLPRIEDALPAALALPAIAVVGGLLAAAFNNLPAAAFGSIWLIGASPEAIVAFLLGVNILNLLTPHGSLATILGRNLARAAGAHLPVAVYLRTAWPYAIAGTAAGLIPLLWRP